MLSGEAPPRELEQTTILCIAVKGELDHLPLKQSFPEDYKLLLNRCWRQTWKQRLSFREILCEIQRMDGVAEKYKSDPVLIETITTKAAEERKKWINGLTILDKELFVVSEESSEIEVYDSIKLSFSRRLNLKEFNGPMDIVSCNRNKCLYIGQSYKILRVDPNGILIKKWSTGDDVGSGLSVTDESNVILAVNNKNKLNEYSPDGKMIRTIDLSSNAGIRFPWHAVKLTNGHFVVSHGCRHDDLHRVCIVDADGKLKKSFGGERGSNIGQMNRPVSLSVDGNGFVLVADQWNSRVLLLDSNLEFKKEIMSEEKHGIRVIRRPSRILLDESNGRILVAECEWDLAGLIKIFQF